VRETQHAQSVVTHGIGFSKNKIKYKIIFCKSRVDYVFFTCSLWVVVTRKCYPLLFVILTAGVPPSQKPVWSSRQEEVRPRQKRQRQKERATAQVLPPKAFICPKCNRSCASRIGLLSHQRACRMLLLLNSDLPTILASEETAIIIINVYWLCVSKVFFFFQLSIVMCSFTWGCLYDMWMCMTFSLCYVFDAFSG
jgi:hypothetical protein